MGQVKKVVNRVMFPMFHVKKSYFSDWHVQEVIFLGYARVILLSLPCQLGMLLRRSRKFRNVADVPYSISKIVH